MPRSGTSSPPPTALSSVLKKSVGDRLERRITVLRKWVREGIPDGKSLPLNLNGARQWKDESLDIRPISSPNEFTKNHPVHGTRIREIAALLTDLRGRRGKAAPLKPQPPPKSADRFDQNAYARGLKNATTQWHAARNDLEAMTRRAEAAEARNIVLSRELEEKEATIAQLRRDTGGTHKGLRLV